MQDEDLRNRLKQIIREEVDQLIAEESSYKFGTLADPKDMDPNDPGVDITGLINVAGGAWKQIK